MIQESHSTELSNMFATKMNLVCNVNPPENGLEGEKDNPRVTSVKIASASSSEDRKQTRSNQKSMQAVNLFVCYDHGKISDNEQVQPYAICCYEISLSKQNILSRADLDTKSVTRPALCDFDYYSGNLVVARDEDPSALLVYSSKDHRGAVAGMIENGKTSCMCCVPAATVRVDDQNHSKFTRTIPNFSSYALVASMDTKSNRYSVDIYDAANKL